jgi:hypothetical protein
VKILTLILSILFSISFGFGQNYYKINKDSIPKIRKHELDKANEFVIKTVGKEAFDSYFKSKKIGLYQKIDSTFLIQNSDALDFSFFSFYSFSNRLRSSRKDIDSNFVLADILDCTHSIISYSLNIRGYNTGSFQFVYVIHDLKMDSCYFYKPERIPPFILKRDTNNFISNKQILEIVKQSISKKAIVRFFYYKSYFYGEIHYFPKHNTYIFQITVILKRSKIRNFIKYKILIIDAYSGKLYGDFNFKNPLKIDCENIKPDKEYFID